MTEIGKGPFDVTLTPVEVELAAMTGVKRQIEALRAGRPDRYGADAHDGWSLHIEGAAGEAAAAKVLDRYWGATVNTFSSGGDVGLLQVRTRSRHDYELIVRDKDRHEDAFILVTGTVPRFRVHGWINGRDAKREEWKREHGGRPAAFFVPQDKLSPLSTLRKALDET